jgi:hypothetical protein
VVALLGSGQTLRDIGFRKENLFQAKCRGNELRRKGDRGMGNGEWGMDTLEVGTLLVDDSDSSATASPVLFFAFVGVTAEESEICPEH